MSEQVLQEGGRQAEAALARLKEAVESPVPTDALMQQMRRDAIIQRFEFTHERLWQWFRRVHLMRGIDPQHVRRAYEVIAKAGAAGWLNDKKVWQAMIRDRNFSSHEYSESSADAIAERIVHDYLPHMLAAFAYVQEHYVTHNPFDAWKEG